MKLQETGAGQGCGGPTEKGFLKYRVTSTAVVGSEDQWPNRIRRTFLSGSNPFFLPWGFISLRRSLLLQTYRSEEGLAGIGFYTGVL